METLRFCPSTLAEGFDTFSPTARKQLFDGRKVSHILNFDSPNSENTEAQEFVKHVGRISLSGVQPKAGLLLDANDNLVKPADGERSRYILKPAPMSYSMLERKFCPANEHLTMQLAAQVYGIETAANAICFFKDGEMAYLTKRFDIDKDGTKFQQEDFASLAGLTKANGGSDYKYNNLSYEECAEIIRTYVRVAAIDILKFFRIIVFNYLTLNDDAHLKNFSLVNRDDGEYRLAPAYDLINTDLHLREHRIFALDKGLFKEGMQFSDVKSVYRKDFEEFGRRIGLNKNLVTHEIDRFATSQSLAKTLIDRSFLSDRLKIDYWNGFDYRRKTLLV
ncbi:MAG: HipA domain-containing protein [Bacteroidales bacterium]|nr:HipA domain-containing protein [Bacteroidales bacterium]